MSMFDWNGDGKKNSQDNFIEYHIYKDTASQSDSDPNGHFSGYGSADSSNRFGCGTTVWVVIIIFVLCSVIGSCAREDDTSYDQYRRDSYSNKSYDSDSDNNSYTSPTSDSYPSTSKDDKGTDAYHTATTQDQKEDSDYHTSSANRSYGSDTSTTQSSTTRTESSTNRYTSPYQSYDDGYDSIYMDDDYDWDRYQSDDDYRDGVDDAMEDAAEYGEGDW